MENMELSKWEIKRRIEEREAQGKPVGRLREALSAKNRELNSTKSTEEIMTEIKDRHALGKPVGQLLDELVLR